MSQLHLYLPDEIAERIRQQSAAAGLSVSAYLAQVVKAGIPESWPPEYFETVVGAWHGGPLERPPQGDFEQRDTLGPR